MSKSRKHKDGQQSLEKRAFETLHKQIHQLEEPSRSTPVGNYSKTGHNKSSNQGKPPKLTITLKLKNGKLLNGICVCFDNPKMPKSKFYFPTGQKGTNGSLKDFCIPSPVDARLPNCERALIEDINDFLQDVHEQARCEFPEWLEKWGCRANEENPLLNLDEIREEWKYKKGQFGIFRLAAQVGFFTDYRPLNAERPDIITIEIHTFLGLNTSPQDGTQTK